MHLRFQIVHVLLSNPMHRLQVSTQLTDQEHSAVPPACQSSRHWVWLVYLWRAAVGTNCSLLVNPGSECHRATHPEVNWSLRERATVPAATPKIKLFPSVCVAGADGGFQATWDGWGAAPTGGRQTPPPEGRWSFFCQQNSGERSSI